MYCAILPKKCNIHIEYTKRKTQSSNYHINDPKAFVHVLSPAFYENVMYVGILYNSLWK